METTSVYSFDPLGPGERPNVKIPTGIVPCMPEGSSARSFSTTSEERAWRVGNPPSASPAPVTTPDDLGESTGGSGKGNLRSPEPSPGPGSTKTPGIRLRRRGKMTRAIESSVRKTMAEAGSVAGGQTSHWTARLWLETLQSSAGVKVTAGHQVELTPPHDKEGVTTPGVYDWTLVVVVGGIELAVSLGMYVGLFAYACFRPRTAELVLSLRSRGMQLSRELGMSTAHGAFCLPGSVALAMVVTRHEARSWSSLGGDVGDYTAKVASQFATGTVLPTSLTGTVVSTWADRFVARFTGGLCSGRGGRVLPRSKP
jgi:hypothetical protein